MNWYKKSNYPLPKAGTVIVSVYRVHDNTEFTAAVECSEIGPLDKDGDTFMYADEIIAWMYLPKPYSGTSTGYFIG
ncbi:hypothetical protein [Arsenicibacter rosenii]|uniref:DUF551 domain-containing protein n=1 Tax=Arsenicibacter rosenii TaxID=1750698 RepID=A0A1S2VN64_9BACT|nr:hypothetical protein [Arsenicibacter rosenii]OIN59840.1 hypothetical protein BLX24_08250 [Arsenicibacter rosenii]